MYAASIGTRKRDPIISDWKNQLYFGDNLEVLRKYIKDDSVDLCYIDPPFNSKRNYNQIYNNVGEEDRAQAQAFVDTWTWDEQAAEGFCEILENEQGYFSGQVIELLKGLRHVLGEGSLLAYLVSMTLRLVEIYRVLRPTGSFYLHCDPTSSHYLKLVLDAIFCSQGGECQNEIVWCYSIGGKTKKRFGRKHDIIFFYTKNNRDIHTFNENGASIARKPNSHMKRCIDSNGRVYQEKIDRKTGKAYRYYIDEGKIAEDYWTDIETLNWEDKERLGYPTQKPETLLQRIIKTSSNDGDTILDAYCGCGTSISVSQKLNRKWIGIDITYQSISLVLKRLEDSFDSSILNMIVLNGIPRDIASATALARKKDDRVRKEFEKWAVLTYSNNRAMINHKKGADHGIDGTAYFMISKTENAKIIFQVKSGTVGEKDIRDFRGTMAQANAPLGVFITLQEPTGPMRQAARAAGMYHHPLMHMHYSAIRLVTIKELIEHGTRLDIPLLRDVIHLAERHVQTEQVPLSITAS